MRCALHRPAMRLIAGAVASAATLTACSNGVNEPQDPAQVPDVRGEDDPTDVFTGAYDAEFREDMSVYTGQEVTLTAQVDELLAPAAFSITSEGGGDVEPLLVIAEDGIEGLQEGWSVTVAATPFDEFDPAEVEGRIDVDLDEDELKEWEGEPYLIASIVEAAAGA